MRPSQRFRPAPGRARTRLADRRVTSKATGPTSASAETGEQGRPRETGASLRAGRQPGRRWRWTGCPAPCVGVALGVLDLAGIGGPGRFRGVSATSSGDDMHDAVATSTTGPCPRARRTPSSTSNGGPSGPGASPTSSSSRASLDTAYVKINHQVVSRAVVVATGISKDGHREVLGCVVGTPRTVHSGPSSWLAAGPGTRWGRKVWSTNPLERLHWEIKRRADVVVPSDASVDRLVTAVVVDAHDEWQVAERGYLRETSMALLRRMEAAALTEALARPRNPGHPPAEVDTLGACPPSSPRSTSRRSGATAATRCQHD